MVFDSIHAFAHHHQILFLVIVFCLWVSVSMIGRMWLRYRRDSFLKKLGWSFILCIPFFGWFFYGGFYTPLRENDVRASVNSDAFM
jgi:hypothetical protein